MGTLAIRTGKSEAQLSKARAERAAAEAKIAALEAERAAELDGDGDVSRIDQTDMALAALRRAILIGDQKITRIERTLRREANARRETERAAAVRTITGIFAMRTAKGARLEELLTEVVALTNDIKRDEDVVRDAWPFNSSMPHYFSWRHDVAHDFLEAFRDIGYDLLPAAVRQAIGYPGSSGFTQATPVNPVPTPRGIAGKLAHNAEHVLERLRKVDIAEPEPDVGFRENAA